MDQRDLRHAYAVMELTPPVDELSLKRQHKVLVRRWHPDQFAQDPAGEAEAAITLRNINIAYDVVLASLESPAPEPVSEAPPVAPPTFDPPVRHTDGGFSMSREQVDAIVESMNRKNRIFTAGSPFERRLSVGVVIAYLVAWTIMAPKGSSKNGDALLGLFCFVPPLALIWVGVANEDLGSATRNILRVFAWAFMAAPAIVSFYFWIKG